MNTPLEGPDKDAGGTRRPTLQAPPPTERPHHPTDVDHRTAFHAAPLAMAVLDRRGRVLVANQALGTLLGSTPERLAAARIAEVAGLHLDGRSRTTYEEVLRGHTERMTCTRRLKHADGHPLWAEITVTPTRRGSEALLTVLDISERREFQQRLRHLQMHDPVTKLPNRALFFERLSAALAESATGRIGLCHLDLDGFTAINETLGYRVGDQLLTAVGDRLHRVAASTGQLAGGAEHLVARLGGDEFALLVEASRGTPELVGLAQAVLAELQRPFDLAGQRLAVSASIGVVERPTEGTTATGLVQAADTTLYWAKVDGKARWTLFDPERNAHRMTRQALSSNLRPAVERGEFTLEYQPIVDLRRQHTVGLEALVRWRHPHFGMLGPGQFIGLAEESGAIVPLGRWVLSTACRQARELLWRRPGAPLFVSVNLAARQVWDSDLVADVARVLEDTQLPPELLQLELTESAVMGSAGQPLQTLQELSDMGVSIAIDDFGTGYSNLAYLSRLPVSTLKLDGTFVGGFRATHHVNPADETIVTTLVGLAHQLGLTVTAEGVEGLEQAERLRDIGCDTGQGWHFARPMPAEALDAHLGSPR
ncbi:EAL domain-containing protein [Streptomyces sp. NPDC005438]|uniref:putative bifunctional diguanylate cyclase/phosphodiesterase n=1 Tax=Streptomyces sp. NPDC005438 TaxID=3156880 RepID=UPI0033B1ED82